MGQKSTKSVRSYRICPLESRTKIIAHRGGRGLGPECTLPLYEMTLALKIRCIDADVHLTKDNQVVVFHDYVLNGKKNVRKNGKFLTEKEQAKISDLTLAEIKQYDVGTFHSESQERKVLFPEAVSLENVQIPTLSQVLGLISHGTRYQHATITLELKIPPHETSERIKTLVEKVYEELKKRHLLKKSYIQSFHWSSLIEWGKKDSLVKLEFLSKKNESDVLFKEFSQEYPEFFLPEVPSFTKMNVKEYSHFMLKTINAIRTTVNRNNTPRSCIWAPSYSELVHKDGYPQSVKDAHDQQIPVIVWTVYGSDDTYVDGDVERLLNLGVDGIITENPLRVKAIRAAINMSNCWKIHKGNH